MSGAIQLSLDVDRFSVASGDPWVHVDLTSSQPLITTAVLLDGRTLVHNPDAGTGFGVRVATLDRLELRAPPGATFPVSYSMAARPSADDYDEATPVPIPIGTAVYGHLDAFDDIDVLSFDLAASVTNFRVHIAPGCAFFDLVTPTGARLPIFDGHLFTYGPGTYLLRIHTERCGEGNWGVTVTVP